MKKYLLLLACIGIFASAETKTDWKAQWINTERCQSASNTWLAYRKTVSIDEVPATLTAHIAADSKYWLWINGRMVVFEGGLKRGPSPYDTYYDSVEIAPYLVSGENTLAVLVWHFGKNGFSHINSGIAALLFEAIAPGVEIVSDKSWKCTVYDAYQNTEAPFPNYRLSESNIRFDARIAMDGWNQPGFNDGFPGAEVACVVGKAPLGKLVGRPIPMFKDFGLKAYPNIRQSAKGDTLFCRLPYNCQFTPYLKVEASEGKTIHMQTDNYRGGGPENIRAEYITRKGVQEYESYGWISGHEMWYIIPEGVKILEVKYRETGYDTEFAGSFHCNDPFLNELWKRSARTLYITMRDNYMDCPERERAQWWGDEVNELGEAFYALSTSSHQLAVKGIHELMNWQRADGSLFAPVPAGNWSKELPLQILASVGWYGFYTQYYYSGDSTFIPAIYDRLHRYLHETWQVDKSGLPIERSGEWSWGDWGEQIDMGVLTNCWYYLALKAEKEFALQLGKKADAEEISRMMYSIEKCFNTKFWTGTAYRSPGYHGENDDRAQAMAVLSGLAPKDKYPAILTLLKKEYHASPYMEKYVLEALFHIGAPDVALQRMRDRYADMLGYKEYTTLFEGWGVGVDGFGGGTINHAWSGGPLTLLSQKVCGIEPTSPGFKTFRVKPQMGSLAEASATVATHYGEIKVDLQKSGRNILIEIQVPEQTTAIVISPKGKAYKVGPGAHNLKCPF